MKKLLSVLILYHFNIRVLHWKLTSTSFDTIHELMSDYYEQLGEYIDEIAEIGLQLGVEPVNVIEAVHLLENDGGQYMALSGNENFTAVQCFEKIDYMFSGLLSLYTEICKDDRVPSDVVSKLEEHAYWIRKELQYKNKRRLMNN